MENKKISSVNYLHTFTWKDSGDLKKSFCSVDFKSDIALKDIYPKFLQQAFTKLKLKSGRLEDQKFMLNSPHEAVIKPDFIFKIGSNYEVYIVVPFEID